MNTIYRFFTPKKIAASSKSGAPQQEAKKPSKPKGHSSASSTSSYDSMQQPSEKEHRQPAPAPRSVLKKSKTMHFEDAAATTAPHEPSARLSVKDANASFDAHYGAAPGKPLEGGEQKKKYRFREDPVEERIYFEVDDSELPHIKGRLEFMYEQARKRRRPVSSSVTYLQEEREVLVWPSGHTYHGLFEGKERLPGPRGTLTLPSGQRVTAWFQKGVCYRAEDRYGDVIDPKVDAVSLIDRLSKPKT